MAIKKPSIKIIKGKLTELDTKTLLKMVKLNVFIAFKNQCEYQLEKLSKDNFNVKIGSKIKGKNDIRNVTFEILNA